MVGAVNVFEASAGVSAAYVSLLIRTTLSAAFLIWGAWSVYGQMHSMHNHALDLHDFAMSVLRVLFLCALMVILIFIG